MSDVGEKGIAAVLGAIGGGMLLEIVKWWLRRPAESRAAADKFEARILAAEEQARKHLAESDQAVAKIRAAYEELWGKHQETLRECADERRCLDDAREQLAELTADLARERATSAALQAKLVIAEGQAEKLRVELAALRGEADQLATEVAILKRRLKIEDLRP